MKKQALPRQIGGALVSAALLIIALLLVIMPQRCLEDCKTGISLWAVCVLPATFPFLFLTALMTRLGCVRKLSRLLSPFTQKLFRLPGVAGYVFFSSAVSGYPVGVKVLADLKEAGALTAAEAEKVSVVASTSGPLFLLGSVGGAMFGSRTAGGILLLSHFLAVVLSGILFRGKKQQAAPRRLPVKKTEDDVLYNAMYASVLSVLCVGGFIAVFYVLADLLEVTRLLTPLAALVDLIPPLQGTGSAVAKGLIEMTGGCKALSALPQSAVNLALCAFLVTLGGASILFQQIAYLKKAGIPIKRFLLAKLVQSCLAFLLCLLLSTLLTT